MAKAAKDDNKRLLAKRQHERLIDSIALARPVGLSAGQRAQGSACRAADPAGSALSTADRRRAEGLPDVAEFPAPRRRVRRQAGGGRLSKACCGLSGVRSADPARTR
jgi:hypothetical protein